MKNPFSFLFKKSTIYAKPKPGETTAAFAPIEAEKEELQKVPEKDNVEWEAVFSDDTSLKQNDDNGYHHWQEAKSREFQIKSLGITSPKINLYIVIRIPLGSTVDVFYRNTIQITGEKEERKRFFIFGYKNGEQKSYFMISPEGVLINSYNVETINDKTL